MIKGIDIKQRLEFVSEADTSEPKTVFVLRPLTSLEMMEFGQDGQEDQTKAIVTYLQRSIVEIKNFDHENIIDAINKLPAVVLGELMNQINLLNNITSQESKN